jgi:predicted MarR family transcription regulator
MPKTKPSSRKATSGARASGPVRTPIHLASDAHEAAITEFEQALICSAEAFYRFAGLLLGVHAHEHNLTGADNVILQQLMTAGRPLRITDLRRFANRDDISNIQYSLRKLIKADLVEKVAGSTNRDTAYSVTEKGRDITDHLVKLRRELLTEPTASVQDIDEQLRALTRMLGLLTGVYDHGSRTLTGRS